MQVFLSHATRDCQLVSKVQATLAGVGVEVFLAEEDNVAGKSSLAQIQSAIRSSSLVVVLLTGRASKSAYVHEEIGYASRSGKVIVPVVSPKASRADLAMLAGLQYIPLDARRPEAALEKLAEQVDAIVRSQKAEVGYVGIALVVLGALLLASLET